MIPNELYNLAVNHLVFEESSTEMDEGAAKRLAGAFAEAHRCGYATAVENLRAIIRRLLWEQGAGEVQSYALKEAMATGELDGIVRVLEEMGALP